MSSGELPFDQYHRAQSLGEGTYGSVVAVYNESGEEFALKMFEVDEDYETMEIGTMREVSILRILRSSNSHPNIVELVDIQTAGEEGCGDGSLSMAMSFYRMGDLKQAIKRRIIPPGAAGRRKRVEVAHGLLSAVAFLHDNHIIHRDIKSDNIMITLGDGNNEDKIVPVLIDFSLAKFLSGPNAVLPPGSTHTGEIGTPTYTAPEVVARDEYGLKSDLWSVGVVLLEMLIGVLTVDRDKAAARLIEEKKSSLPESPYVNLIRGLLEPNVNTRLSAREALSSPVFEKHGMELPPVKVIDINSAFSAGDDDNDENDTNVCTRANRNSNTKQKKLSSKYHKMTPRERLIKKLCSELGSKNPKTELAAAAYAAKMEELDDEMDDIASSQTLLDCVVVANRFYEEEPVCLEDLDEDDEDEYPSFKSFSVDDFRDNEMAIFMVMDYSLYLRNC